MAYAVVACSQCREPWAVELRHKTSTCPRCQKSVELARRTRLWQGDSPTEARQAIQTLRADMAGGREQVVALHDARPVPRHDSPIAAAAAKANAVINKSQKAETIALWLTRLQGDGSHEDHLEAMRQAGLDRDRAEKEITRMLAMDVLFEPRAGRYRCLEA